MSKPIYKILIKPILTEKSVRAAQPTKKQPYKKYIFEVALDANKYEIAQAVEEMFAKDKVKVASVNTMHVRGRERRMSVQRGRRASVGQTPAWKKAIVTLEKNSPGIPMLEGA